MTTSTDRRKWSPVRARHGAVRQSPVRRRLSAGDAETTSSARRQPGTQWVPLRRGRPCLYDEWLVGHGYLSASPSLSYWQAQTTTQTRRSPRRWPSSKRPEPPRPSPNTTSRDLTGPRQLTTRSIHMMGQSDFHREGCDSPQMTPLTERSTSARVTWNALFGSSGKMLAISPTRCSAARTRERVTGPQSSPGNRGRAGSRPLVSAPCPRGGRTSASALTSLVALALHG
jgi:hypothetical protein